MIKEIWFPWDDAGDVQFLICGLTQKDRMELLKNSESLSKKWQKRALASFWDSIDFHVYNEKLIQKIVIDANGLKNKHLLEIYDCIGEKKELWKFKGDGKRETEIIFESTVKNELSHCYSQNFIDFINAAINAIDDANRKEKENELKN